MTPLLLQILHWISGVVVLAEALNKLERTSPFAYGLTLRNRVVEWLKAIGWSLLATGAAGALISPLMRTDPITLDDVCVVLGFATLIIRTRVREG